MEFFDVIKNRYACKNFDGRPVEREQLNMILEAGTNGEKPAGTAYLCCSVRSRTLQN